MTEVGPLLDAAPPLFAPHALLPLIPFSLLLVFFFFRAVFQDIAPGTSALSDWSSKPETELFVVRKTAPTLRCASDLPVVKFGPMLPSTRVMLQRFFNPWNDELRRLLIASKVPQTAGFAHALCHS